MTPADRLQPHITARHRQSIGMSFDDNLAGGNPLADAECLAYAKAEIARLRTPGSRTLAEHDHESKIRCLTLERMVAAYEAKQELK